MSNPTICLCCGQPFDEERPQSMMVKSMCVPCVHSDLVEHCKSPPPRNDFPSGRWTPNQER